MAHHRLTLGIVALVAAIGIGAVTFSRIRIGSSPAGDQVSATRKPIPLFSLRPFEAARASEVAKQLRQSDPKLADAAEQVLLAYGESSGSAWRKMYLDAGLTGLPEFSNEFWAEQVQCLQAGSIAPEKAEIRDAHRIGTEADFARRTIKPEHAAALGITDKSAAQEVVIPGEFLDRSGKTFGGRLGLRFALTKDRKWLLVAVTLYDRPSGASLMPPPVP